MSEVTIIRKLVVSMPRKLLQFFMLFSKFNVCVNDDLTNVMR